MNVNKIGNVYTYEPEADRRSSVGIGDSKAEYVYSDESYAIRGAIFAVCNAMAPGYLEAVYQECLEIELAKRGIPFESQKDLSITYSGVLLKQRYCADIVCYDKIILELKAVKALLPEHRAQLHNYLKTTGFKLGLLVNFGAAQSPEIVRVVN